MLVYVAVALIVDQKQYLMAVKSKDGMYEILQNVRNYMPVILPWHMYTFYFRYQLELSWTLSHEAFGTGQSLAIVGHHK